MLVKKCDNCKKEIKKVDDELVVGLGWPNYSFCRRCGKPILAFLKKRRLLRSDSKSRLGGSSALRLASLSTSLCVSAAWRLFSFG